MKKVKNSHYEESARRLTCTFPYPNGIPQFLDCKRQLDLIIARALRRHFKRGYDQGVIAMATKINQVSGK